MRKKLAAIKSRLGDLILLAEHDAGTSRGLVANLRSAQCALAKSAEWKSLKTGETAVARRLWMKDRKF